MNSKIKMATSFYFLITVLIMPLLLLQACWARISTIKLAEAKGQRNGCLGNGEPINILILGDSAAAGVGVTEQNDALSGRLVTNLAIKYQVNWKLIASSGLTSSDLLNEIRALPLHSFDYVLVSIGVNDVTHLTGADKWTSNLNQVTDLLVTKFGAEKVLMTALPPMHLFTGLPQPLRWWLGLRAKKLNLLMMESFVDNKHCIVMNIDIPFADEYLAKDGFHPSQHAYRIWADQVADALHTLK